MQSLAHGFPDRDQPLPPPGSTASQGGVMVPLTTPEQFLIGSSNSIPPEQQPHQQQPDGEPPIDQGGGRMDNLEQYHLEQEVASSWVDLNTPNSQIAGVPAPRLRLPDRECGSMPASSNPSPHHMHFQQRTQMTNQEDQLCQQDCQPCSHKLHRTMLIHSLRSLTNVGFPEVHVILCGQRMVV